MGSDSNELLEALRSGKARVGVWGNGFIGFSTLANFANNGIQCIGYDIDADLVRTINKGEVPIETLEYWLGFDTEPLVDADLLKATTDQEELLKDDVRVHFVCIPTEQEGDPWTGPLETTVENIASVSHPTVDEPTLVIIESTLTPGMTAKTVLPIFQESDLTPGEDLLIGVAPRRDWFTSPDKSLTDIPRVFGGQNERTSQYMRTVLGVVCENLVEASDHEHAEMVKSVENAYRHMGITLANQIARAYPNKDVREVLELAATKWNIPAYFPSVGVGGYCIPLSSKYVINGARNKEELSILSEAIRTDETQPHVIADALVSQGVDSVTVLGLAYKGDVKVDVLSPTLPIVSRLQEHGVNVSVNDPYFDDEYVTEQTGAKSVPFPEGMSGSDAVIVVSGHRVYRYTQNNDILDALDCSIIIDSPRVWDEISFQEQGIEYYYTGAKGWLGPPENARTSAHAQPH